MAQTPAPQSADCDVIASAARARFRAPHERLAHDRQRRSRAGDISIGTADVARPDKFHDETELEKAVAMSIERSRTSSVNASRNLEEAFDTRRNNKHPRRDARALEGASVCALLRLSAEISPRHQRATRMIDISPRQIAAWRKAVEAELALREGVLMTIATGAPHRPVAKHKVRRCVQPLEQPLGR